MSSNKLLYSKANKYSGEAVAPPDRSYVLDRGNTIKDTWWWVVKNAKVDTFVKMYKRLNPHASIRVSKDHRIPKDYMPEYRSEGIRNSVGGSVVDFLRPIFRVNDAITNALDSHGLSPLTYLYRHTGRPVINAGLDALGLGRKSRKRVSRKRYGGKFFEDNLFSNFGHDAVNTLKTIGHIGSYALPLLGLGNKKRGGVVGVSSIIFRFVPIFTREYDILLNQFGGRIPDHDINLWKNSAFERLGEYSPSMSMSRAIINRAIAQAKHKYYYDVPPIPLVESDYDV